MTLACWQRIVSKRLDLVSQAKDLRKLRAGKVESSKSQLPCKAEGGWQECQFEATIDGSSLQSSSRSGHIVMTFHTTSPAPNRTESVFYLNPRMFSTSYKFTLISSRYGLNRRYQPAPIKRVGPSRPSSSPVFSCCSLQNCRDTPCKWYWREDYSGCEQGDEAVRTWVSRSSWVN